MKVAILVVLYDKQVDDSSTIKTLLDAELRDTMLVVHNNGPVSISISQDLSNKFSLFNTSISLVNCINNKPLSMLYNDFISTYSYFDKFILLDDDSEVTSSFINALYEDDYDLEIPKIVSRSDEVTYYPLSNGKVITHDGFIPVAGTHSIGSGLMFTNRFVSIFNKHNMKLFDENYALYGVDVSLFRRMWYLNSLGEVFKMKTSSTIIHSLSRTEQKQSTFRHTERLIDYAISVRRYPSIRAYASFIKKGLKQLIKFKFKDFTLMCSSFISGVHPRSKSWNKS